MEVIKSLKKKKNIQNTRRSMSKLKINLDKKPYVILRAIANYFAKDLKEMDLYKNLSFLKFNNFHVEVTKLTENDIPNIFKFMKHKCKCSDKSDFLLYKVIVDDPYMKMNPITIFTSNYKIPNSFINKSYRIEEDRCKFLDIGYLYGILKSIDIVFAEVEKDKELYLSDTFKSIFNLKEAYSERDFKAILSLPFNTSFTLYSVSGIKFENYLNVCRLIIDVVIRMQLYDSNIELMDKYNTEVHSECARAFETKKNIPQKILKVMDKTSFLSWFSYVEIDSDTDLNLYRTIEHEWIKVEKALSLKQFLNTYKPQLRFKKLGKHRAAGLYYPFYKCICVDINSPGSFLHEFGHFIDFTYTEKQLSLDTDFYYIIKAYREAFWNTVNTLEDKSKVQYLIRKSGYFFTPTEIFARCFELYLLNKGVKTSFLKEKDDINIIGGYPCTDKELITLIDEYYSKLISIDLNFLKDEIPKTNTRPITHKVNVDYIPPVITTNGQLLFAI